VTIPVSAILFKDRPARRITLMGRSGETALAKPNYSYDKRQREIAKKKQQDEKDARKREAREAAKPAAEAAGKTPPADH
jgi:sRNA-binding protein